MKRFISIFAAVWVLLAAYPAHAAPGVQASLDTGDGGYYPKEIFAVTFTLHARDVNIGRDISITPLPEHLFTRVSNFEELPSRRWREGNEQVETRQFRWHVAAIATGEVVYTPSVEVSLLRRVPGALFSRLEELRQTVPLEPVTLRVDPLPETGRPDPFSGAVGQFSMTVQPDRQNVAPGDVITLTTRIKGFGILDDILPPRIPPHPQLKTYEPRKTDQTRDELVFSQSVVPESTTLKQIPPMVFTYFDPATGVYRELIRGPFPLSYQTAAVHTEKPFIPASAQTTEPLSPPSGPTPSWQELSRHLAFLGLWLSVLIMAGASLIWMRTARQNPVRAQVRNYFLLGAVLALLCSTTLWVVRIMAPQGLWHTLQQPVAARLAPFPSARTTFELPRGVTVRVVDTCPSWTCVTYRDLRGWIPSSAFTPPPEPAEPVKQ